MYPRYLEGFLKKISKKYPVVTVLGPRQSGKSTLCRHCFSSFDYVSLEEPDRRRMAQEDPRGFFRRFPASLVLDEVQRVPELLSYIQTMVDEPRRTRQFVLTGSHQLLLMEKITQSLAGRTFITNLLPFSRQELVVAKAKAIPKDLEGWILTGGYPRIYDKGLNPSQWLEQYYQTYVERDVRLLVQVGDLDLFDRFVRLCAGRVGQLLNLSSLANDCGVSQPTARSWLSVLQASFVCYLLKPHFKNFHKRLIKSPKLYFYDTGLLCYLLNIRTTDLLKEHPLRGSLFENWVITEKMKKYFNRGEEPPFYFWRDVKGHEIDLVIDRGIQLDPTEIKSAFTFHPDFFRSVDFLNSLQNKGKSVENRGECIYAGEESFEFKRYFVRSWREI